jgi:hypothetical protein
MKAFLKYLAGILILVSLLSSCDVLKKGGGSLSTAFSKPDAITTSLEDAAREQVLPDDFGDKMKARQLSDLPTGPGGGYLLTPGLYEITTKSYCLHPGTAAPGKSKGDGYLFAPLKGDKAAIIEAIMVNADLKDAWQQDVQSLIWAVLARTNFADLSPNLKKLAAELLNEEQLKELNKDALKVLSKKALAKFQGKLPPAAKRAIELQNQLREKLTSASASYEELEQLAVLPEEKTGQPSAYNKGRWSRHPDGYYIRYFPNSYRELRMQLYLPATPLPASKTGKQSSSFFSLYPAAGGCVEAKTSAAAAVPANKNQQRLGSAGKPATQKETPDTKKLLDEDSKEEKFKDVTLEQDYQRYTARKKSAKQKPRPRLEWMVVRDNWLLHSPIARGNAFNGKARSENWYKYHEIVLVNDYRVDSYVPDKEIISRKATDLENITEETYRRYLQEMVEKYSPGVVIKSNTAPELYGKKLKGKMFLEIPQTNECFAELERYKTIAQEYKITLRFKPE